MGLMELPLPKVGRAPAPGTSLPLLRAQALSPSWGVFGRGESQKVREGRGIFVVKNRDVPPDKMCLMEFSWMSWFTHPKEPLGCDQGCSPSSPNKKSSSHPQYRCPGKPENPWNVGVHPKH